MIFVTYKQRPDDHVHDELWVRDNGDQTIQLDQADFVVIVPLRRNSGFHVISHGIKKGFNSLFDWLTYGWIKRWLTVNELEMPDLPWFTVD